VANIPELTISGETGWLIPTASIEALIEAMEKFLTTPLDILHRMGKSAYARAVGRHAIDTEATQLALLFRQFRA